LWLAALSCAAGWLRPVSALEGGSSHYFPGAYNDFGMNLQMAPGVYFRDDLTYYTGRIGGGLTLGRNELIGADVNLWFSNFKLAYVSDLEFFGGRYGAALVIPVIFDLNLFGNIQAGSFERSGSGNRGGMGDLVAVPLSLTWKWDDFNVNLSEFVFTPSGYYDGDNIINLGRNYWSFDTVAGVTWLHPTGGHEVSFNLGFMSNLKNTFTDYQSGDELHLDYTVAQHFSEEFGIGVTGFFYHQLTDDHSPLLVRLDADLIRIGKPGVGGFRGEGAGVGPIIRYSPMIGDQRVNVIGKWLHEYDVRNRFHGDVGMLSVALDL
jgi:hypothetical protein